MLLLEDVEKSVRVGRRRAAPDRSPRDDETAEIFQEAFELRIAGGVGDFAMKREVLIDGGFAAADGGVDRRKAVGDFLDLRRAGAFGGQPRRRDLDAGAQFHDVEDVAQRGALVEIHPVGPTYLVGDEGPDPLAGDHQAIGPQGGHRLAYDGAADPGGGDHFLFGGKLRPRRQFAADDIGGEAGDQLAGEPARGLQRLQQTQIFWRTLVQMLDTALVGKVII